MLTRGAKNERGQALVTVALMSVFLLAIMAVAADIGFVWLQRRNLQNAADAAALAGAQQLPEDPALAKTNAELWAAKNASGLTYNVAEVFTAPGSITGNDSVRATVKKNSTSLFGASLGFGDKQITAHAAARVRGAQLPGPGVIPLAINEDTYNATGSPGDPACLQPNQYPDLCRVTLKEYAQNNSGSSSAFGYLDIFGSGAQSLCAFLKGGSPNAITDPVDQEAGNVSSIRACLDARMAAAAVGPPGTDSLGYSGPCYTLEDTTYLQGGVRFIKPHCNPLGDARRNADGIQPTSVVVMPIIKQFCNGNCDLDIVGDGTDLRTFAYFVVDLSTVQAFQGIGPTCSPPGGGNNRAFTASGVAVGTVVVQNQGRPATNTPTPTKTPKKTDTPNPTATNTPGPTNTQLPTNTPVPGATNTPVPTPTSTPGSGPPPGQCWITGYFVQAEMLPIAASGVPVGEYGPGAVIKVVQLVE